MAPKEAWTDGRLDDLSRRMDAGFARVDGELRAVNARLDALQRTIILGFAGLAGSVLASAVGALLATQL